MHIKLCLFCKSVEPYILSTYRASYLPKIDKVNKNIRWNNAYTRFSYLSESHSTVNYLSFSVSFSLMANFVSFVSLVNKSLSSTIVIISHSHSSIIVIQVTSNKTKREKNIFGQNLLFVNRGVRKLLRVVSLKEFIVFVCVLEGCIRFSYSVVCYWLWASGSRTLISTIFTQNIRLMSLVSYMNDHDVTRRAHKFTQQMTWLLYDIDLGTNLNTFRLWNCHCIWMIYLCAVVIVL